MRAVTADREMAPKGEAAMRILGGYLRPHRGLVALTLLLAGVAPA